MSKMTAPCKRCESRRNVSLYIHETAWIGQQIMEICEDCWVIRYERGKRD